MSISPRTVASWSSALGGGLILNPVTQCETPVCWEVGAEKRAEVSSDGRRAQGGILPTLQHFLTPGHSLPTGAASLLRLWSV